MTDVHTSTNGNGRLTAPVRNRYFYGKLLDVAHLEMEQRYFLESSRLINRLGLGAGVLCGLDVRERAGKVVISPGVAIDGYGREIVVTDPIVVDDPWALTDDCARPTGKTLDGGPVVLCLAYHECETEPAPVLVADCDIREECVPGAVRERYWLLIHDAAEVELPGDPCSVLGRASQPGDSPADAGAPDELRMRPTGWVPPASGGATAELYRASMRTELGARPVGLRERLCAQLKVPCAPTAGCVPIALVSESADGKTLVVDPCGARRTIYSNAVLLDLILCLAEHMDECCGRKVTTTAPVITAMTPAPASDVKRAELVTALSVDEGGIALGFDRKMRRDRLEHQDEWLRVVALVSRGGGSTTTGSRQPLALRSAVNAGGTAALPVRLEFVRTANKLLDGSPGFTAVYKFKPVGTGDNAKQLLDVLKALGVDTVRFVVIARSDDVTQIVDTADPPELLDADFAGSNLDSYTLDVIWDIVAAVPALGSAFAMNVEFPAGQSPPSLPASGNGIEGGVFHTYFDLEL